MPAFTIGVDYGTSSVRALVVDCADGRAVGGAVFDYPSGQGGVLLDERDVHLARQNPADYIDGLQASVTGALAAAAGASGGFSPERVIGIGVDTTGSTPMPVDAAARPLALDPRFARRMAAQAWLWKDHTGARRGGGDHAARRASTRRTTWRRSAASTRRSGSGRRSGAASRSTPRSSRRQQAGSSCATSSRRC